MGRYEYEMVQIGLSGPALRLFEVSLLFEQRKCFIWFIYCLLINIQLLKGLNPTARLLYQQLRSILQADICIVYKPRHTTWRMAYNQLVRRGEELFQKHKTIVDIFIRFIYIKLN
jgi:hypothetical protein